MYRNDWEAAAGAAKGDWRYQSAQLRCFPRKTIPAWLIVLYYIFLLLGVSFSFVSILIVLGG